MESQLVTSMSVQINNFLAACSFGSPSGWGMDYGWGWDNGFNGNELMCRWNRGVIIKK